MGVPTGSNDISAEPDPEPILEETMEASRGPTPTDMADETSEQTTAATTDEPNSETNDIINERHNNCFPFLLRHDDIDIRTDQCARLSVRANPFCDADGLTGCYHCTPIDNYEQWIGRREAQGLPPMWNRCHKCEQSISEFMDLPLSVPGEGWFFANPFDRFFGA